MVLFLFPSSSLSKEAGRGKNKISKRSLERDGIEGETPVCVKRRMGY